ATHEVLGVDARRVRQFRPRSGPDRINGVLCIEVVERGSGKRLAIMGIHGLAESWRSGESGVSFSTREQVSGERAKGARGTRLLRWRAPFCDLGPSCAKGQGRQRWSIGTNFWSSGPT